MRPQHHQQVAADGQRVEQHQGSPLSPMVGQPSARIGVNGPQQGLQGIEEADYEHACAQGFEVFRGKTQPKPFPGARQQKGDQEQAGVASQGQKLSHPAPNANVINSPKPHSHNGLAYLARPRKLSLELLNKLGEPQRLSSNTGYETAQDPSGPRGSGARPNLANARFQLAHRRGWQAVGSL